MMTDRTNSPVSFLSRAISGVRRQIGEVFAKGRPSIEIDDEGTKVKIFTLPSTSSSIPSVLVFALPKSGSTMLDGIMRSLCEETGHMYVSVQEAFFRAGVPLGNIPPQASEVFLPKGYCYGGFRLFPRQFEMPILDTCKSVLLVRDPRDMLVSHYFSMRESHPEPGKGLKTVNSKMAMRDRAREIDIDTYVIESAPRFLGQFKSYRTLLLEPHHPRLFRYEDIIYDKASWVRALAAEFDWPVSDAKCEEIASRFDVVPDAERTDQHIRQVHPGNFHKKLKPETIATLNQIFSDEIKAFGYTLLEDTAKS